MFWLENLTERNDYTSRNAKMIFLLKWILGKQVTRVWNGSGNVLKAAFVTSFMYLDSISETRANSQAVNKYIKTVIQTVSGSINQSVSQYVTQPSVQPAKQPAAEPAIQPVSS
jgi:hypothetical protein